MRLRDLITTMKDNRNLAPLISDRFASVARVSSDSAGVWSETQECGISSCSAEQTASCAPNKYYAKSGFDLARSDEITPRQIECLLLAAEGLGSPEIGRRLSLSSRTVDDHLTVVCRRLGVRTRVQAVAAALDAQLIKLPEL